jgi:hypothetical protein
MEMEQRQLPAAEITFDRPPLSGPYIGIRATRFLLLGGRDGSRDEKVVSRPLLRHGEAYHPRPPLLRRPKVR